MLYEKKLMILTGQGKGVVLIEKSGLGVKFALRTFSMPARSDYKAGIITPKNVIIRDLPATRDPAAVFFVDDVSLEGLHFAVFDNSLRLYGSTGVKMWEANVMDILKRHCTPVRFTPDVPAAPALPPLGETPRVLPLPDGTGIPQSRMALYGDEALADSDFYTSFDIEPHLPRLDAFLDSPRVLNSPSADQSGFDDSTMPNPSVPIGQHIDASVGVTDEPMVDDDIHQQLSEESMNELSNSGISNDSDANGDIATEAAAEPNGERASDIREAAACRDTRAEKPWEMTARWLKGRAKREAVERRHIVRQIADVCSVPKLREVSFFERLGADIDKLFSSAPRDGELTALLPDIEWVKVSVDPRHTVSVGRSGTAFLCYAVAGNYEKTPPIENAQWLPKLRTAPTGKGYWLVFQDLGNGNIIV